MRVLLDFVGMPTLYKHHRFTFSTATLAELRREDVPGCFSCSLECKYQKCRYTVLLIGGLAPLISFTTHSSKSHIFSFPFDLVVILHKLIYELFIKHLTIFLCKKQDSQSYWYAYCSYLVISYFLQLLLADLLVLFQALCLPIMTAFSHQKFQNMLDCLHCTLNIE